MGSFSIWHWLILAALLYAGYRLFARSPSKPSRAAAPRPPAPQVAQSAHHWPALGEFGFSIVGESNISRRWLPLLAITARRKPASNASPSCGPTTTTRTTTKPWRCASTAGRLATWPGMRPVNSGVASGKRGSRASQRFASLLWWAEVSGAARCATTACSSI